LACTASCGAARHTDFARLPVDLRIMFLQPSKPQQYALRSQRCYSELCPFRVIAIAQYERRNFGNHAGLIWRAIDIKDGDRATELTSGDIIRADPCRINETACRSAIDECLRASFDRCRGGLEFDIDRKGGRSSYAPNDIALQQ
jgi:hypothetical protein